MFASGSTQILLTADHERQSLKHFREINNSREFLRPAKNCQLIFTEKSRHLSKTTEYFPIRDYFRHDFRLRFCYLQRKKRSKQITEVSSFVRKSISNVHNLSTRKSPEVQTPMKTYEFLSESRVCSCFCLLEFEAWIWFAWWIFECTMNTTEMVFDCRAKERDGTPFETEGWRLSLTSVFRWY